MYSIVQESHDAIQMVKAGNETEIVDALYRISSLVNKTVDSDEALELILATVIEVLDGNRANIALRIPESEKLRIEVSWGQPQARRGSRTRNRARHCRLGCPSWEASFGTGRQERSTLLFAQSKNPIRDCGADGRARSDNRGSQRRK